MTLLPCPFCGCDKLFIMDRGEHPGVVFIKCNDCEAEGPPTGWGYPGGYQTRKLAHDKAIELWNKRAPVSVTVGDVLYTMTSDGITAERPAPNDDSYSEDDES